MSEDKRIFSDFDEADSLEDTADKLNELKAALEAGNYSYSLPSPVLQVQDLSYLAEDILTPNAKYDLSQKAMNLSVQTQDGKFFRCVYFAVRTKTENRHKGVKAIAKVINDLSQKGLIHSCLAKISSIELARLSLEAPQSVVFCFVLVPDSHYEDIKVQYKHISVEEGSVGNAIEDLSVPSNDGEFFTTVRVSNISLYRSENPSSCDETVKQEIERILAILPRGTVVKSVTRCAVTDLSLPYEVRFYNSLLQEVKYIETDYVRSCTRIEDRIEQFNVFTGIRYYDKERNELYKIN